MPSLVPDEMPVRDAYRLLVSIVVPRPIAWVSSMGASGSVNLAPFSFFNVVGDSPPVIMVSISTGRHGKVKDTLRNVQETGEFVVHIVSLALAQRMNETSTEWEYGTDEFEQAGLTKAPSVDVAPPRIAEAPIAMEVKLIQVVPIEGTGNTMILGRIIRYHIQDDLLNKGGTVDALSLHPVARLGGDDYTDVSHTFTMRRPRL